VDNVSPTQKSEQSQPHLLRRSGTSAGRREEDNLVALDGQLTGTRGFSQHTLGAVADHGISQPFGSSEGDPSRIAFADTITYNHANQRMVEPLPLSKHPLKVLMGLDGLHESLVVAHRETLAALSATTGENGATGLGGHTGAEAGGLWALAPVRLVSTLHG